MTKDILMNIISNLHHVGYEVVGLVSDMGPTNIGLWKALNIKPTSPSFENPETKKRVHVFADVPHLIKLMRNHFIDNGFILPDESYIGKEVIEQYICVAANSDYKLAHKISEKHINVVGTLRQNVRLAVQLFSNTVSKALQYCGEKQIIKNNNWEKASSVFSLINDWFDLLNTQFPVDKFTKSYGMDLDSQNSVLDQMDYFITNMKVYGSKRRLPFQTGILVTNASLRNLLSDLKMEYSDVYYIITRRLNSDVLEKFFSFIKGMIGSSTHISPLEFKYCLRWYFLGKYSNSVFTEHRNTEDTNEESLINCLSACTVNKAEIINNDNSSIANIKNDVIDEAISSIESLNGTNSNYQIPECSLELLKKFELQMLTNELHMSDIEKDCLEYVTGSVSRKFLSKYPSLGEKVSNVIGSDSSWTEQMSKGNLIKPSKSMIQVAKVLEVVFNEYHTKNTLRKTPGVMKNVRDILVSKLQNIIEIPVEVLECMVRTRTFIRLNSMNRQLMDKVISTKNKIKKFVS